MYARIKRALDLLLVLAASPVLLVALALIALAVKLDSPGPALFTQRRVGKDKEIFLIYKYRTMRADTPGDVPTHQLSDPGRYITRVGGFLRKFSLDELPQAINILRGQMSFVGPRPALWNQHDLIALRDQNGANALRPGLTGWAQINGRDELPIAAKAALDGEYARNISFLFDTKIFFLTFAKVLTRGGVREGV